MFVFRSRGTPTFAAMAEFVDCYSMYRVVENHRMLQVAIHFLQKSH